ncbi:MAG TPA: hypothetical protein VF157_12100 [Chloroflexota bacterium]
MADEQQQAWPQDDLTARATLLAWLDGELPLEQAAAKYAGCFPPAAGMDAAKIKRTWGSWNAARKRMLAQHIRRSMSSPDVSD